MKKRCFLAILCGLTVFSCSKKNESSDISSDTWIDSTIPVQPVEPVVPEPVTPLPAPNDELDTLEPWAVFQSDETGVLTESDDVYSEAEILFENEYADFFKPVVNLSEVYPDMTYEYMDIPEDFYLLCSDSEGNFYDVFSEPTDGSALDRPDAYLIKYDPKTGEVSTLFDPEGETLCSVLGVFDEYLLWQEDTSIHWVNPVYHLYNLETNEDKALYRGHGLVSDVLFLDGKFYFSDSVNEGNILFPNRFICSYDIANEKIEVLYDKTTAPQEYNGKLAWISLSSDGESGVFCNDDGAIFKTDAPSSCNAKKDLIFIFDRFFDEFESDSDETMRSEGFKIVRNNETEPLFMFKELYTGYCWFSDYNGKIFGWTGWDIGNPMFYDSEKDVIVNVDFLENEDIDRYSLDFYGDKIILSYHVKSSDEPQKYLLITL